MPTVVREGVRLRYSDSGAGPPVLFHTGGGGDGTMWRAAGYVDALPGRRHLLFDHRGHGLSDRPRSVAAHRVEEYAADLLAVLDHAGIERTAMVGYSDGARLIYGVAARHPERVAAIVGVGGVPHPAATAEGRADDRRARAAEVRRAGMRALMESLADGEAEAPPGWLMDNLAATDSEMFALELEGWASSRDWESFARIEAPTLIVCGELENAGDSAPLAAGSMARGWAVVVPGFGHLQTFWRSDVTAPLIGEFLERHLPRRGHAPAAAAPKPWPGP